MDKQIKRHIERRGIWLAHGRPAKGLLGSDSGFDAFLRWFHEDVMMFDSMEYRRRFWREACQRGHTVGHMPNTAIEFTDPRIHKYDAWLANLALLMAAMGVSAVVWHLARALDAHIRQLRRPTYYEAERLRRARLATERRRIRRRTTTSPCPTPEMLRDAFAHALDTTANMIRFGSMLEDLECYVDNSIVWSEDKGRIVGRRGGIRQWLRENAPDLSERYKTVMKYKALAKKFRQAVGVCDPIPAAAVLPPEQPWERDNSGMARKRRDEGRTREHSSEHYRRKQRKADGTEMAGEKNEVSPVKVEKALPVDTARTSPGDVSKASPRETTKASLGDAARASPMDAAKALLEECEGTVASLSARLALMVSADFVPDENTARTKISRGDGRERSSA